MAKEILVPALGESVVEGTVLNWLKNVGDAVAVDDLIVELETDKVTVEVPSPVSGVLSSQKVEVGDDVAIGDVLALIDENASAASERSDGAESEKNKEDSSRKEERKEKGKKVDLIAENAPSRKGVSPSVRVAAAEAGVDPAALTPSGPKGNLVKADVVTHLSGSARTGSTMIVVSDPSQKLPVPPRTPDPRGENVVKMSRLRRSIAQRLKDAQNSAAMLTTFNEINMDPLLSARATHKDRFIKTHDGVKLGMMSFFVLASVQALREFPAINSEIHGTDIVYKNYYDIGIAVGAPQGLVVPIVRDADQLDVAEIEAKIADFGKRSREGALSIEELSGGTFTITNGGIFGSLLSTPILNPPQSAILGMHKIQKRPIVDDEGQIAVATMMYVAMSYDHRIVDGKDAVQFLVRIKELVEDPLRLLLRV